MLSRYRTFRPALVLALASAILSGCRTTDPSVQLLESELRYLEDKVYALQDVVSQKEAQIASVRRENESLRQRLGLPDNQAASEMLPSPTRTTEAPAAESPDFTSAPMIELGEPTGMPDLESLAPSASTLERPVLDKFSAPAEIEEEEVTDRVVTQMQLNPKLTGGYDADGQPGDEGIMVVLEPQNAAGQYVDAPGPVSIVLLDPAYQGKDGFVARWDYDTTESAQFLRRTLLGKGIHLKIPWSDGPPDHENLILHVRYTTAEGEVLQEKKEISVDLRSSKSARWTPASVPLPLPRTVTRPGTLDDDPGHKGLSSRPLWRPFR